MPELPEVETVRRGLAPLMEGVVLARVELRRPDLRFPFPDDFAGRLTGRRVVTLGRRAKYLVADIEGGETLVMHLGMSGRFVIAAPLADAVNPGAFVRDPGGIAAHDHVVFHLASGASVTYNDPRRFGFMLLVPAGAMAAHPLFAPLGVEPLGDDLTPAHLATRARGRKTDFKAFLLDQRVVAGLGNIYVAEALFRAGLDPTKPAGRLARASGQPSAGAERLVAEIKAVLADAIGAGGSTLRDYRRSDGAPGTFQRAFAVYGREGEACRRPGCTGRVRRIVQAGRSTFYCPRCQR